MAIRGASPNTKLKLSSPSQKGAAGNIMANTGKPQKSKKYQPESDNKEIHGKTAPNYQAGFLESPYFSNTVIDDV